MNQSEQHSIEPGSFAEKLAFLDAALTGKSWAACVQTSKNAGFTPESFLDGEQYYLSDGGYSRINCDPDTNRIYLDSVSLDRPKAQWVNCKELIADIESEIEKFAESR